MGKKVSIFNGVGFGTKPTTQTRSAVAQAANDLDDGFAFYVDLYGHVDATIRYGFQFPTLSF